MSPLSHATHPPSCEHGLTSGVSISLALFLLGRTSMGSEKDGMKRSIKSLLASIFVSLFPVASAVAGPYEDGVAAYERGDYAKAVELFRKAAEQGDAYAQYNLGQMYDKGKGVKQDYVETHKWVSLAAAQGLKKAIENREMVASQLTPAQMIEAQRLAREWKSKK